MEEYKYVKFMFHSGYGDDEEVFRYSIDTPEAEIEEDFDIWFNDHLNEVGGYEYVTEEDYKGE